MRNLLLRLLLGLLIGGASPCVRAATEAELRAAVIYNIARFVQWPATMGDARFTICSAGSNAVTEALTALQGKALGSQITATRTIGRDHDLSGCHMLYVAPDNAVRMAAIAALLSANHEATLTISDAPNFLARGGMVQLVVVEERQRFLINQDLAEKANLSINAKLLQLALPRD